MVRVGSDYSAACVRVPVGHRGSSDAWETHRFRCLLSTVEQFHSDRARYSTASSQSHEGECSWRILGKGYLVSVGHAMTSVSLSTVSFSRLFDALDIYAIFPFLNILCWAYFLFETIHTLRLNTPKNVRTMWNFFSLSADDACFTNPNTLFYIIGPHN